MKYQKPNLAILIFFALLTETSAICNIPDSLPLKGPQVIKIGKQNWCIKNLDVVKYRNGDPIPQVQDMTEWSNLSSGAWCYADTLSIPDSAGAKLYNWYAVTDPRGLAPEGFHVASDADWGKLTTFLGGMTLAGRKMKTKSGWRNNRPATNESLFSALPEGFRRYNGTYCLIDYYGFWWTTNEFDKMKAWFRSLKSDSDGITRYNASKKDGMSVRCLAN